MEKIIYIDKPIDEYDAYREKHEQKTNEYFDELTRISKINVEENRAQSKKINDLFAKHENAKNKYKKIKAGSVINIILFIFAFIIGGLLLWMGIVSSESKVNTILISVAILSLLIGITLFTIQFAVILKNLKNANELEQKLQEEYNKEREIGYEQTAPLRSLFGPGMKVKLFREAIPFIKLENFLKNEQLAKMVEEYGMGRLTNSESNIDYVQSGEIYGNPFLFARVLEHELGTKIYTGHLTIRWTEMERGSDGKMRTVNRSEVLTASVEKPYPFFNKDTKFIWGSQAAPDLSFERNFAHVEQYSDKEIRKLIKNTEKLLKKREKDDINFTSLSNTDFEALFNAFDRDNQTQFRLAFTPLAQQNMVALLRDKEKGFGDDFTYEKNKKINIIKPEHLADASLQDVLGVYYNYDYDEIKTSFKNEMQNYFRHVYFTFAPMFSVPIFQQTKSLDFIYKNWINGNLNEYEHEHQLSYLPRRLFTHRKVKTNSIIKTQFIQSEGEQDTVRVSSFGYDIKPRIDYIPVYGSDGNYHDVPVHWDEYIRLDNDVLANITKLNSDPTDRNAYESEINQKIKQNQDNKDDSLFSPHSIINII
ncbi:MAG1210 family protein [Mycoplasma sp. HS2188]|uniref:MAG1210 family protein n=1 Tax=Mycoplasma sp. HS2188 TaxID=2976765 RepID=UPI0021AABAB8|nr:hypothetical protein [Mycoplasma sp. HS2188]MCT4469403.1 hypothetical protein [Mycoplasma sp. HS2188]